MARNFHKGRLYYKQSEEAKNLTAEEALACEIYALLRRPMTVAVKHAFRLNVKPASLPAIASRVFAQPHLRSYIEHLESEYHNAARWFG